MQNGARVYVTGRSSPTEQLDGIAQIRCDHRQDADVEAAFARIIGETGNVAYGVSKPAIDKNRPAQLGIARVRRTRGRRHTGK
ncbi:MAG: hypothetical protein ACRDMZ_08845, partial [Solirubrobacteraceae bacterium]